MSISKDQMKTKKNFITLLRKKLNFNLLILALSFSSCKDSNDVQKDEDIKGTFSIEEGYFKEEMKKVISQFNQSPKFKSNSFLVEYYSREADTVVEFSYAVPYTCKDIVGHITFNGNDIFLYSTLKEIKIMKDFKINKPFLDCYKYVNERDIDSPPRIFYHVKDGIIVSRFEHR